MDDRDPSKAVNLRTRTCLGSPSRMNSLCSPVEHVSRMFAKCSGKEHCQWLRGAPEVGPALHAPQLFWNVGLVVAVLDKQF